MRVPDEQQTTTLLDAASDPRLGIVLFLAVATGLRSGEILGLRWTDVDLDN